MNIPYVVSYTFSDLNPDSIIGASSILVIAAPKALAKIRYKIKDSSLLL